MKQGDRPGGRRGGGEFITSGDWEGAGRRRRRRRRSLLRIVHARREILLKEKSMGLITAEIAPGTDHQTLDSVKTTRHTQVLVEAWWSRARNNAEEDKGCTKPCFRPNRSGPKCGP